MKILLTIVLLMISIFANASVSSDLGNFFGSMGFDQNATDSHAYQGQEAGYYTGGSLFLRNGVRNLQVVQIDVPSYRAGCGGIDLFFGGMSYINSAELIRFFKDTMQNASGYLFNLALQTEVPEIAHTLEVAQDWAQKMNSQNLSSCEMAEDLVGGLVPQNAQAQRKVCADIGVQNNIFSDWAMARAECGKGDKANEQLTNAATDPAYKDQVTKDTNVVWNKLMNDSLLKNDKELAEFFMSLSGTLVFDSQSKMTMLPSLLSEPLVNALMYGGSTPIYQCKDDKCLNVAYEAGRTVTIDPTKALVNRVMVILEKIKEKHGQDNALASEEQGLIASTSLPVEKFIMVDMELNSGIDFSTYAEVIADDILSHYLSGILTDVENLLVGSNYSPAIASQLSSNLHKAQRDVHDMEEKAYKKIENTLLMIEQSQEIERQVAANVSSRTKENMNFGGS